MRAWMMLPLLLALAAPAFAAPAPGTLAANDNRRPAGVPGDGALALGLVITEGSWQAEDALPAWHMLAFAEEGRPATTPGPLIRVLLGTRIDVTIRNDTDAELWIEGLYARSGAAAPVHVAAHGEAHRQFMADTAGTFFYWGTLGKSLAEREGRDSELTGALIVDAPGAPHDDRIFVISRHGAADEGGDGVGAWAINGRSWPQTERLDYRLGEHVAWRWINASGHTHPMHLHGMYFRVTSSGDNARDARRAAGEDNEVATQLMPGGSTMAVAWVARTAGNWLFHCHILFHVLPENRIPPPVWYDDYAKLPHDQHMAGLVLGLHVADAGGRRGAAAPQPRRLALRVAERPGIGLDAYFERPTPLLGYALDGSPVSSPGPVMVLERGRPVEIAIHNAMRHATSVHWHGVELANSYYDGVPHWGTDGDRVTPWIDPGADFTARFTPPRTGTFIYHTHFNDYAQLTAGLYGALVVVAPGRQVDTAFDHVFVIGQGPDDNRDPILVNGVVGVPAAIWRQGHHRIRLVGITAVSAVHVALLRDDAPVTWRPLAKDGADLPATLTAQTRAEVDLSPGETYDFDVAADEPGALCLRVGLRGSNEPSTIAPIDIAPMDTAPAPTNDG
jgi:FtsP/CotA-like multicopper oxidase with cupredoxin domain